MRISKIEVDIYFDDVCVYVCVCDVNANVRRELENIKT